MTYSKVKYHIICLLFCFCFNKSLYSQCDLTWLKTKEDSLFFSSANVTEQLKCIVGFNIVYSHDKKTGFYKRKETNITDIKIVTFSKDKTLKYIKCTNMNPCCFCDTIGKYINNYYVNDLNRILTMFELTELSGHYGKVDTATFIVKMTNSWVYIYPRRMYSR